MGCRFVLRALYADVSLMQAGRPCSSLNSSTSATSPKLTPTWPRLAVGKSRREIEAIVKEDPFCERGLAHFRIIEFRASQRADDIQKRIETS
jgi:hypothetical protein